MNNSNCSHTGNRTRASWVKARYPASPAVSPTQVGHPLVNYLNSYGLWLQQSRKSVLKLKLKQ
ncbi:hypothetical protein OUZ56_025920 [Daphnia magna]|uniref:Uncharacterized protein n=1 Tax=Daphnia magna TaxID=35525 RepID=A0ABQ9ZKV8_9CRUS|nr:hypothetical protein OUZ56_025920 [Daphnia magna]